jgi:hypothetical protein
MLRSQTRQSVTSPRMGIIADCRGAEAAGLEPTKPFRVLVFETSAIAAMRRLQKATSDVADAV